MSEVPSLAPGLVVGGTYEIISRLGSGGMGEVWLAKHLRLAGKQVAIKVLKLAAPSPESLARFKREAEIAARLEHPNIVQVLDFNELPSGEPYIVMEFLKGESLASRAHGRALPPDEVASIMRQVGAALQAAHREGVVHRDLKPDNIFLVPTAAGDQVKVLDFGISRLQGSSTVQTAEAAIIGTPRYMSPEQARGNSREATKQSDVFSLGSIVYELLTGEPAFDGEQIAQVVFRVVFEAPADVRAKAPGVPEQMARAIDHALMKDVATRTPDVETFVYELTGQPLGVVSQPSGIVTQGVPLTPSLDSGATRISATPKVETAPAPPPPARQVSGRKVITGIVLVTVGLAAVVTKVRMNNWAEREVYRGHMRDAGYVMLADGTFLFPDASNTLANSLEPDADNTPPTPTDSPNPPVVADPDDGTAQLPPAPEAAPTPKVTEEPVTTAEAAFLTELEALSRAKSWDALWDRRTAVTTNLKTRRAVARGLTEIVVAGCGRSDNGRTPTIITTLRTKANRAELREAKRRCVALYPDASAWDW